MQFGEQYLNRKLRPALSRVNCEMTRRYPFLSVPCLPFFFFFFLSTEMKEKKYLKGFSSSTNIRIANEVYRPYLFDKMLGYAQHVSSFSYFNPSSKTACERVQAKWGPDFSLLHPIVCYIRTRIYKSIIITRRRTGWKCKFLECSVLIARSVCSLYTHLHNTLRQIST